VDREISGTPENCNKGGASCVAATKKEFGQQQKSLRRPPSEENKAAAAAAYDTSSPEQKRSRKKKEEKWLCGDGTRHGGCHRDGSVRVGTVGRERVMELTLRPRSDDLFHG